MQLTYTLPLHSCRIFIDRDLPAYNFRKGVDTAASRWSNLQDIPVADAKPDDIKDLLGGALFKALYKWMEETGPVYLLPTGTSGMVVSDCV